MIKKLELKHLAAYFPHELQCIIDYKKVNSYTGKLTSLRNYGYVVVSQHRSWKDASFRRVKPILRPLSDLTKEIEVGGEMIIPLVELAKIEFEEYRQVDIFEDKAHVVAYEDAAFFEFEFNERSLCFTFTNSVRCGNVCIFNPDLVAKLYEWHFDIFGLIKNGLATSKNKI